MKALRRPSTAVNALLALLIVGAGFWGWTLLRDTSQTTQASASGIRTVTATEGDVIRTLSAAGAVASASTATATFATAGTVTQIKVKVGQEVRSGALLAQVDPTDAQRDLALARANLEAAEDARDRATAAGTDTDNAANAITQAELAVDEAEAAVAGTRLTAPMGGTVTAVNGTLGGSSTSGSAGDTGGAGGFVDIADLKKLQITAAFSEADATELKAGQSATIVWNALRGAETTGEVVAVDPTATSEDGVVTYGVTVSLPNPPDGAKPGQTVTVSVVTGSVEKAVMVNSAAVSAAGNRRTVTVVDGTGRQEVRQVKVGLEGDDATQITSGLAVGERLVLPTTSTTTTGATGGTMRMGGTGFTGGGAPPGGGTGGR
ncbi:efflux RND transporter periplasmic adaptor subunit [Actinoplanes utahensis]|uniref:Membrane protein n=1 Tax=Actinoplanes utahensis TaxID=1869 RepID=A0A0A6UPF9_ACTUT|nr:efflux RND transporter periplasmic adaptor subunit [Actinoplanes utahensis]KHD78035.1 membrane protein [Actinoplanes utahensis]GIF30045.1 RND transporter [Actinoplanes utahensis]